MQEQNENGCHFDAARRGTGTASDEHQDNDQETTAFCQCSEIDRIESGSSRADGLERRRRDLFR